MVFGKTKKGKGRLSSDKEIETPALLQLGARSDVLERPCSAVEITS